MTEEIFQRATELRDQVRRLQYHIEKIERTSVDMIANMLFIEESVVPKHAFAVFKEAILVELNRNLALAKRDLENL